ncbi:sulfotransferase family 2 domain-containing protein [Psychroserpens sp. XS_ASV72]|uniref:sulfotransferase family 2 domain-containing protein n=1 Tax=Psychroserpens sp. XS_ASV72 TaxID=3241293 RepID=UPI003514656A
MGLKIGKLSLSRFIRGMLGARLIDPIEVYFLVDENLIYPIISKSGCSTVKLDLIRRYNPEYNSKFPEIHQVDPKQETDGKILRLRFYNFKKYRTFCEGKSTCLIIRNPYERIYSCFLDVSKGKNIMYDDPSGLTDFFKIKSGITFQDFIDKVVKLPDHLCDRHFRSQSFFLQKGVKNRLNKIEIILLENYSDSNEGSTKLNTNNKQIPSEVLESLKNNTAFKKRFAEDILLYESHSE